MDPRRRDVWVVIAAFNEASVIRGVVAEVVAAGWPVVVVDDGSRDATAAAARMPARSCCATRSTRPGAALQTGIDSHAAARQIATFDADASHTASMTFRRWSPRARRRRHRARPAVPRRGRGATAGRRAPLRTATRCPAVRLRLTGRALRLRAFRASAAPQLRITQ
jgi:glycosyltransferase involved in cell wall biosynthesis